MKITPKVSIKDKYGYEIGVVEPPGWAWILGFALGGCQWAIDDIMSGKVDGAMAVYEAEMWKGENI